ncbi:hypothetical protein [Corallococcus terminator]|uniref:hypothetical protein n=1 Tax=Corallococcus terminator TaxID=2316733 RepID=UPI0013150E70|nr:hypothetical protein [Corallococcus terminator]
MTPFASSATSSVPSPATAVPTNRPNWVGPSAPSQPDAKSSMAVGFPCASKRTRTSL